MYHVLKVPVSEKRALYEYVLILIILCTMIFSSCGKSYQEQRARSVGHNKDTIQTAHSKPEVSKPKESEPLFNTKIVYTNPSDMLQSLASFDLKKSDIESRRGEFETQADYQIRMGRAETEWENMKVKYLERMKEKLIALLIPVKADKYNIDTGCFSRIEWGRYIKFKVNHTIVASIQSTQPHPYGHEGVIRLFPKQDSPKSILSFDVLQEEYNNQRECFQDITILIENLPVPVDAAKAIRDASDNNNLYLGIEFKLISINPATTSCPGGKGFGISLDATRVLLSKGTDLLWHINRSDGGW